MLHNERGSGGVDEHELACSTSVVEIRHLEAEFE